MTHALLFAAGFILGIAATFAFSLLYQAGCQSRAEEAEQCKQGRELRITVTRTDAEPVELYRTVHTGRHDLALVVRQQRERMN